MIRHHSAGEDFDPSAAEMNAWGEGARFARRSRLNGFDAAQRILPHGFHVSVQIQGNVNVEQYGFAVLTEPLYLPGSDHDAESTIARLESFAFKAEVPDGTEDWWNIYAEYKHPVILQKPWRYQEETLAPAVVAGISLCRISFTSPGSDKPNTYPTTAWPTSATTATALPGGPLKIIWMQSSNNDAGWRWAYVKVDSWMDTPNFVRGTAGATFAQGATGNVSLDTALGTVTTVTARAAYFDVTNADELGLAWDAQSQEYVVIAILCQ
jgi:hypothetical protein